jgi:hypothetical protein
VRWGVRRRKRILGDGIASADWRGGWVSGGRCSEGGRNTEGPRTQPRGIWGILMWRWIKILRRRGGMSRRQALRELVCQGLGPLTRGDRW